MNKLEKSKYNENRRYLLSKEFDDLKMNCEWDELLDFVKNNSEELKSLNWELKDIVTIIKDIQYKISIL